MKSLLLSLSVCLLSVLTLSAQQIQGTLTDKDGEALIGASILVKGTASGTVTDFDGNYVIEAEPGQILIFSYTGYATQEIEVGNQSTIDIELDTDAALLSEVVVTGYGSQKRENLTGAVGVINSEILDARPITNATQALQGQVGGVWVNQNSGEPGEDGATIRIRGIGTLNSSDPLVLIDGIEAPFGNIDPNDIETITVLKDASSAAIYGSRAANGVVLVTTKRGSRNNKPTFSYNGFAGTSQSANIPDYIWNSAEFMALRNEADENSGNLPLYRDVIDQYQNGPNTNWFDEVFQMGSIQQHNLSIRGGSEKTNFNVSLGYLDQGAIVKFTEGTKRYNARLNLDTDVTSRFKIGGSFYISQQESDLDNIGQDGGVLARATRLGPNFPAFDDQGRLADRDRELDATELSTPNILAEVQALNRVLLDNRFLGSFYGEYEVIDGLKLRGTIGANYQADDDQFFNRRFETFDWRTGDVGLIWQENRRLENVFSQRLNITSWIQATYEKTIGKNDFKFIGGFNQESSEFKQYGASRLEIPSNSLPALNTGNPETSANFGTADEWALRSYFGRANYVYDEKYLFEFNVRYDGSSRFGPENRWAAFPSFSAGWILSREDFLADNQIIDFLKVRASWGQLGNQFAGDDQNANNYPYTANISFDPAYSFGGSIVGAAAQTTLGNPFLRWETTTQINVGVNAAILGKVSIEADYFIRNAQDILFNQPNPSVTGVRTPTTLNLAEVENRGWETTIRYSDKIGELGFSISGNLTNVDSEVLSIDPSLTGDADRIIDGAFILQRGQPINALYGLEVIGIFQTQEEIDAAPDQSAFAGATPGDLQYRDLNGDGVITQDDRTVLGQDNPRWIYGLNLNFDFKGFDIAAIFQGVGDAQTFETSRFYAPFNNSGGVATIWRDRWTPDNPDATLPKIRIGQSGINYNVNHSRFVTDRSYFRLKNLQLGYSLPSSAFENNFIESLRVFVNGTNLLTVTDYIGFDPERAERSTNGVDGYPQLMMFTGGVSLRF
jgi:TonB-linked SusC/RagA family outer membrane protein